MILKAGWGMEGDREEYSEFECADVSKWGNQQRRLRGANLEVAGKYC